MFLSNQHTFGDLGHQIGNSDDPQYLKICWQYLQIVNRHSGLDNYLCPTKVLSNLKEYNHQLLEVLFCESTVTKEGDFVPTENSGCINKKDGKRIVYFLYGDSPYCVPFSVDGEQCTAFCIRLRELTIDEEVPQSNSYTPVYAKIGFRPYTDEDNEFRGQLHLNRYKHLLPYDKTATCSMNQAWRLTRRINEASEFKRYLFPVKVLSARKESDDYNLEVLFVETNFEKKNVNARELKSREMYQNERKQKGKRYIYRLHVRNGPPLEPVEPENFDSQTEFWMVHTCKEYEEELEKDPFLTNYKYCEYGKPNALTFNFV